MFNSHVQVNMTPINGEIQYNLISIVRFTLISVNEKLLEGNQIMVKILGLLVSIRVTRTI